MTNATFSDADMRAPASPQARSSAGQQLDDLPLNRLHILVLGVGAVGFSFDLLEVALGNVLSAVFSAPPYSLAASELSLLLSAMYVGAIIGAPAAGSLADRYGRRATLMAILAVLALTSFGAAMSRTPAELIAARFLSGLSLGAYPPLLITFLTEILPARHRGRLIMIVSGLAALGPVAALFLVRWLTPLQPLGLEGWRWCFLLGALGAGLTAVAFRLVPESPRWLSARARDRAALAALARFEAARPIGRARHAVGPARAASARTGPGTAVGRRLAFFGGLFFLMPWAVVAFPLLMGAVLIEKGFDLSDSLLYVGISLIGPVVGSIAAAFWLDLVPRRTALIVFGIGMVLAGAGFAVAQSPGWVIATSFAFTLISLLHVPTLSIYAAESFPTAIRARTGTFTWALNRVASALAPLVLLPVMKAWGIPAMFSVVIAALLASILLLVLFGTRDEPRSGVA